MDVGSEIIGGNGSYEMWEHFARQASNFFSGDLLDHFRHIRRIYTHGYTNRSTYGFGLKK